MPGPLNVLVAARLPSDRQRIVDALREGNVSVDIEQADSIDSALSLLSHFARCAFIDASLGPEGALSILDVVRRNGIHCPIVLLFHDQSEAVGAACMEAGAIDCLYSERMPPPRIRQALRHAQRVRHVDLEMAQTTERLRAEEERLNRVVETIADGVLILDRHGRYVFANSAASQILGTPIEVITATDYTHPPWRRTWLDGSHMPDAAHPFAQVMRSGRPMSGMEVGILRPDGRPVIISLSAAPLRDRHGAMDGIVATLRDVTQSREAAEALRKGQHLIQQILNTTPDLVYIYDVVEQCNVYANRQMMDVLGYTPEQLRAMGTDVLSRILHPEDRAKLREHHVSMQQARDGEVRELEYRMRHANGQWRWMHSRDVVFARTAEGRPYQVLGSALDITERRQAEESLVRSERRYRSLFESMLEGFALQEIITDEHGTPIDYRYVEINPAFERLTGLKRENVIGRRVREVLPRMAEFWIDFFGQVALTGKPNQSELHFGDRYFHVTAVSPWSGQFAVLFEDITQRRQIEAALRESNQRLEALIKASPLAVCAIDLAGNVIIWNPAAERMFGWTEADAMGKLLPIVQEDKHEEFAALRDRVLRQGPFTALELRRKRKDGSDIDIEFSTAAVRDADGNILYILAIMQDVTEARRLKERLLQAHRMESVGRLAGSVAHEFNNLLAVICGYSEALLRRLGGSPLETHVAEIQKAAERGGALTRQLLSFSRRPLAPAQLVDLNTIVSSVEKMLQHVIGDSVHIDVHSSQRPAEIRGDPGRMEQVLVNLALNARDAMPGGGVLTIATDCLDLNRAEAAAYSLPAGQYVRLTVADTGCGMSPDVQARIFEPFFTTKDGTGTGLGLSIVYEIVQQSGGEIVVRTEVGKGTIFELLLPCASDAADSPS